MINRLKQHMVVTVLVALGFVSFCSADTPTAPTTVQTTIHVLSIPDFSSLVEEQGSTVVSINVKLKQVATQTPPGAFPMPPNGPPGSNQGQASGSGFIVNSDGYIITNAHVVNNADEIWVKLTTKKKFKAKLIGSDPRSDVALIKIEATGLPIVKVGDPNKSKVGQWAVAIGAPFGFENTATAGIISAKGRRLPDNAFVQFIQSDVAVNPGNSGGPLFNIAGEVIGINSEIYSRSGGFEGLSFSIPIDTAMGIVEELKVNGKITRGRIGLQIQNLTEEIAKAMGLSEEEGALVAGVEPNSPSEKAGLKVGDVILLFNDLPVKSSADLPGMVAVVKPGTVAKVTIWRNSTKIDINVTVAELKDPIVKEPAVKVVPTPQVAP